ncbi:uncharacterized protein LOC107486989 [Arachis duranensis]|uniref:Uncharacterized protein LOC107486989 n=1 Tax=Arachis duranensis TaxID=130453 RepID=A0A6P4DCZ3_ARADU|nr:uncharacterized protein LOC107486989 [Arachis duranensis]
MPPKEPIQEPEVSHPQELQEETKDEQFSQFLEVLKNSQINIPFAEILEKMPPCDAYMKSIPSEKKALKGDKTMVLTKESLCDLSSSINLMPLFVMKKLQIQEAQPTRIALQMAGKSLRRLVENVLVKVGELFLPADFVILDMEEDANDSIILGRPFLTTRRALIDVERGN